MSKFILLPSLLFVAACGEGSEVAESAQELNPTGEASMPSLTDVTPVIETARLPWDIPIMPGARYISGSPKFSKPSKRRGGDAIATIAVKGTVTDIINYYAKVLPELGFEITENRIYDETSGSLHVENAKGEKFQVSAMRGGSKTREGESSAALVASKPKIAD